MEKTYRIIEKTDGYRAARNAKFNGKCEITICSCMTLEQAHDELLRLFNNEFGMDCPNWGMAVIRTRDRVFGAAPTFKDGTRSFDYDGYGYSIEEEVEDGE